MMQSRESRITQLRANPNVSVLIVGAGINGIGTFRDLALQGVDVVMVDRGDYCSGASAASSHMVHGGIRYLENGEFRLVREAVRERNRLIRNAPHLVKPLPTVFPIFKWFSGLLNAPLKFLGLLERPAERGAVVIKLGLLLYDFYTGGQRTVPRHVFYNRKAALEKFPRLNPEVLFAALYYDGAMPSPERIALELIREAVVANPEALPLNYVRVVGAEGRSVHLRDEINGETFEIYPRIVVNAAGPWIDRVNRNLGAETRFIGGTKGSHLVLDHPELRQAIGEHEFFFENNDGRIVLIYPLFDRVMIGTSDIRIEDPDEAVITEEEVDYFFSMIRRVFPDIEVSRSHIVFTFSGVRPLQRMQVGTTGQISRDHKVQVLPAGEVLDVPVLSLVGGKWTSFRAFSEEAADVVLRFLGRERQVSTRELPIGGSKGWPAEETAWQAWLDSLAGRYGGERDVLALLLNRYGALAEELLEQQGVNALALLHSLPEYTRGEIAWLTSSEDVQHLDDLLLRRTMIAMLGRLTPQVLEEVAAICAAERGWSAQVLEAEKQRLLNLLYTRHRMDYNRYVSS